MWRASTAMWRGSTSHVARLNGHGWVSAAGAEPAQAVVGERRTRGFLSGGAVDAPARMSGGRAEVEAADSGLGASGAGDRPEDQLLVQLRRTSVDRALVQVRVAALELVRTEHTARQDLLAEARRTRLDAFLPRAREPLALVSVPPSRDPAITGITCCAPRHVGVGPHRRRAGRGP